MIRPNCSRADPCPHGSTSLLVLCITHPPCAAALAVCPILRVCSSCNLALPLPLASLNQPGCQQNDTTKERCTAHCYASRRRRRKCGWWNRHLQGTGRMEPPFYALTFSKMRCACATTSTEAPFETTPCTTQLHAYFVGLLQAAPSIQPSETKRRVPECPLYPCSLAAGKAASHISHTSASAPSGTKSLVCGATG